MSSGPELRHDLPWLRESLDFYESATQAGANCPICLPSPSQLGRLVSELRLVGYDIFLEGLFFLSSGLCCVLFINMYI